MSNTQALIANLDKLHRWTFGAEGEWSKDVAREIVEQASDLIAALTEAPAEWPTGVQNIPMYAMLDIFMALHGGDNSEEFETWATGLGYAETWAQLCSQVRAAHISTEGDPDNKALWQIADIHFSPAATVLDGDGKWAIRTHNLRAVYEAGKAASTPTPASTDARETLAEVLFYDDPIDGSHVFRFADSRVTLESDPYISGMFDAILAAFPTLPVNRDDAKADALIERIYEIDAEPLDTWGAKHQYTPAQTDEIASLVADYRATSQKETE